MRIILDFGVFMWSAFLNFFRTQRVPSYSYNILNEPFDMMDDITGKCQNKKEALAYLNGRMPSKEVCVWRWTSTEGLRVQRICKAVAEITMEARLMIFPDRMRIVDQSDVTRELAVQLEIVKDELDKTGEYWAEGESMFIPLNMNTWALAAKAIRAGDVVGMCVTKSSINKPIPGIDMYIINTYGVTIQEIHIPDLIMEYASFGPMDGDFTMIGAAEEGTSTHRLTLKSHQLKQILSNAKLHGVYVQFKFGTSGTQINACRAPCNAQDPEILCSWHVFHREQSENKWETTSELFAIEALLRCTKASSLSKEVVVTYAPSFPLEIRYNIGSENSWGELTYRVASKGKLVSDTPPQKGVYGAPHIIVTE